MSSLQRHSLRTLVVDGGRPSKPAAGTKVWNLNLDQIESGTGRVIAKQMIPVEKLGSSTYPFEAGTVLYSKLRPYLNKVVVANETGVATTELVPLRCNPDRLLPQYLAYFLRSSEFLEFANTVVAGAKMPRMVMGEFWEYKIPTLSIPEQRRIVAILDQAHVLCTKRREALAQLDELQRGIFIEMFGDPSENPKNFPTRALADLVADGDTINYGVVQPGDDVDVGVPLIRVGDLIDGRVRHDWLKKIAPSIENAYKRSRLKGDEILVSCVGSVGVVALASDSEKGFNIARAVARIRLSDATSRIFMAAQLNTPGIQRYFTQELRTVSQPTLNIKQITETTVMYPPIEYQKEFEARIDTLGRLKAASQCGNMETEALFASLLHSAFRGDL